MERKTQYDKDRKFKEDRKAGSSEFLVDVPSNLEPVYKNEVGTIKEKFKAKQPPQKQWKDQTRMNKGPHKREKEAMKFRKNKFHGGRNSNNDNDKPLEFSSKKRPPILKIFTAKDQRKVRRDPRFEETSGEFNSTIFEAKYGNILEEAKNKDKEELLCELKKERDPDRISQIKYLLKRISDQKQIEDNDKKKLELTKKLKEEKRKQLKIASKAPVFLKKSELKQAQLVEKFKELKASSKLSKYIEKKRKRNVARERNKMFPDDNFN